MPPLLFELVDRPHIVIHSANVQPISRVTLYMDWLPVSQHVEHEVIEAIGSAFGHMVQHGTVHDVNAHAYQILKAGFFFESRELPAVRMKHAEVHNVSSFGSGNRE